MIECILGYIFISFVVYAVTRDKRVSFAWFIIATIYLTGIITEIAASIKAEKNNN